MKRLLTKNGRRAPAPVPRADWAANPWVWCLTFRRVGDRGTFNGTERPIIFSARMINALIANAKTQTRRLNRLPNADPGRGTLSGIFERWIRGEHRLVASFMDSIPDDPVPLEVVCPFGRVGDRLWVREGIRCNTDKALVFSGPGHYGSIAHRIADNAPVALDKWKWKNSAIPAIHMPRDLCRIVLEITELRCERLQSITEADAMAEGADPYVHGHGSISRGELQAEPGYSGPTMFRDGFRDLWTEIHGEAP